MYLDLFGVTLNSEDDISWFTNGLRGILKPYVEAKGKIHMVVNYDGFDLSNRVEDLYREKVEELQEELYLTTKRYSGQAFQRARLKTSLSMQSIEVDELFDSFDTRRDGVLSVEELRDGFMQHFHMSLTPEQVKEFVGETSSPVVDRYAFMEGVKSVLADSK